MNSPIILFTYNRLHTLKVCINSLKECDGSTCSDLVIYSDAARGESDVEKVNIVREYLKTIDGFKSVNIVLRDKNFGVDFNIMEAIKEVSAQYDSFIVIEDDLIFNSKFIYFMNSALKYYEKNEDVITISAFSYIKKIMSNYQYDVYFTKRPGSWGWATWSDKINKVDWEIKDAQKFLASHKMQSEFNEWGSDLTSMLKKTIAGITRAWDIRLCYYQYKNNLYTVFPTQSLVIYNGFGADASNTSGYNRYKNVVTNVKSHFNFPDTVVINPSIKRKFTFRNSIFMRAYSKLLSFLSIN